MALLLVRSQKSPTQPAAPATREQINMEQDTFAFGDDAGDKVDPVYDWDWWDILPRGLSHQARLILQLRRDLRAVEESYSEEDREFFKQRIVMYRDTYNANKCKEAATPQGPSTRSAAT